MIIAQYGNNSTNAASLGKENHLFPELPNQENKSKSSEFDLLLSTLNSNQGLSSYEHSTPVENSSSFKEKREEVKTPEHSQLETPSIKESKEIIPGKESSKLEKPVKSVGLEDFRKISDLNKKMDQVLEKGKKLKGMSSVESQILVAELKGLMAQFQHIIKNTKLTPEGNVSLERTLSSYPGIDQVMSNLLKNMLSKVQAAKNVLSDLGLQAKKMSLEVKITPPLKTTGEESIKELHTLDKELDKTLSLLKDFKEISHKKTQKEGEASFGVHGNSLKETPFSPLGEIKTKSQKEGKGLTIESNHTFVKNTHPSPEAGKEGAMGGKNQQGTPSSFSSLVGDKAESSLPLTAKANGENSFSDKVLLGKQILEQMQETLKGYVGKEQSHFSIQLKPEELGEVKVIMDMKEGAIKGQIIVENEVVKDILQTRFQEMKEMFQGQGINMAELSVKTQLEHQQERNQAEQTQALFSEYKSSSEQVKLSRQIDNITKSSFLYEKSTDTSISNKEFIITA